MLNLLGSNFADHFLTGGPFHGLSLDADQQVVGKELLAKADFSHEEIQLEVRWLATARQRSLYTLRAGTWLWLGEFPLFSPPHAGSPIPGGMLSFTPGALDAKSGVQEH